MEMSPSQQNRTEYQYVRRRAGHVMVAYDKRIFVWGGYMELPHTQPATGETSYHSAIDIWMFDPLLDTWTRKRSRGDIPNQLSGSCAAVHDQHMYLFGGWTNSLSDDLGNNVNCLWRLHLPSLTWKLLFPRGTQPFPCDKAACWVHNNRFYVFGGFGPARTDMFEARVNFVPEVYNNGWIDQLAYYNIGTNEWIWPKTKGAKPSPRAAHAADVYGDKVYIFGGRFKSNRMNDLHCLDLKDWTWSGNLTDVTIQEIPEGRSWHIFKFVSENKAVVYGGFSSTQEVLEDIWVLDVGSGKWCEFLSCEVGPRLWHTAAVAHPGELTVCGGIKNNLLDHTTPKDHAEDMLVLRFSPPSLQRLAIEIICQVGEKFRGEWKVLPHTLQHILAIRYAPHTIS